MPKDLTGLRDLSGLGVHLDLLHFKINCHLSFAQDHSLLLPMKPNPPHPRTKYMPITPKRKGWNLQIYQESAPKTIKSV
jgi:hypothetical protein